VTSNSGHKETDADIRRKMAAVRLCEEAWGEKIEVLDSGNEKVYHKYFMTFDKCGNLSKIVEFKGRQNTSTLYPTLIVSLSKIEMGVSLSRVTHCPFFIVANFIDGKTLWHQYYPNYNYKVKWGGNRRGRPGEQDEPVMHIPMSMFNEFVLPIKLGPR